MAGVTKRILAIYRDQNRASRAAQQLATRGIDPDRVSILVADSASGQLYMASEHTAAKKTAITGAAIGSTGALLATSILGAGAIVVGPIALALVSSIAGGLLGGLVGLGIPENEAEIRTREIVDGAILVGVDVDTDDPDQELRAIAAIGVSDYLHISQVETPAIGTDAAAES